MPMSDEDSKKSLRIAVVGPCSSGKSTLIKALQGAGYTARHIAQEHSYVANMWQRITKPDVLIYLDIDYPNSIARRPHIDGGPQRLEEQHWRLRHARQYCDIYLDTSNRSPSEIQTEVLQFLDEFVATMPPTPV